MAKHRRQLKIALEALRKIAGHARPVELARFTAPCCAGFDDIAGKALEEIASLEGKTRQLSLGDKDEPHDDRNGK